MARWGNRFVVHFFLAKSRHFTEVSKVFVSVEEVLV